MLIYPFDGYSSRWSEGQQAEWSALLPQYTEVVRAAQGEGRGSFLLRNRILVDSASCCIAYCTRQRSGAAYTVRYAQRKGLSVFNVAEDLGH